MVYFKPAGGYPALRRSSSEELAQTFRRANARKTTTGQFKRIGHTAVNEPPELPSVPPRQLPKWQPSKTPYPRVPGWTMAFNGIGQILNAKMIADTGGSLGEGILASIAPGKVVNPSPQWSLQIDCGGTPDGCAFYAGISPAVCLQNQVYTPTAANWHAPGTSGGQRQIVFWKNSQLIGSWYGDTQQKWIRSQATPTTEPRPYYVNAKARGVISYAPSVSPSIDPNSTLPLVAPLFVPTPIPFWAIPYRVPNPARVPGERTEFGYAPALSPGLAYAPATGVKVNPDGSTGTVTNPPGHTDAPPGPKTKERKTRMSGVALAIWRAANWVTEAADFIEALYEALPTRVRREARKRYGYKLKAIEQMEVLYHNWHLLSIKKATINIVEMNINDWVIAIQAKGYQNQMKDLVKFVDTPLGAQSINHIITGERKEFQSIDWDEFNEKFGLTVEGY